MDQRRPSLNRIALFIILLASCVSTAHVRLLAQQRTGTQQPSARLQWTGRPGVKRYRLQVARDRRFKDIVFDRIVMGNEYVLTELPQGPYFWHVAPAIKETGRYSGPQQIEVAIPTAETASAATPTPSHAPSHTPSPTPLPSPTRTPAVARLTVMTPPVNSGWRAAIGGITQPVAANLRNTEGLDLAGVNSDGMVFALDGASGAALWSARFRPSAKRGEPTGSGGPISFNPLPLRAANGLANLLVAYDGGVRALAGATGRELWRAALTEPPLSAAVDQDGVSPVAIVTGSGDGSSSLVMLDAATGRVISNNKLETAVIGSPMPFNIKESRGVMLALKGGILELHDQAGARLRSVKMDTEITTAPLIIEGPFGPLLLIGTESGLISIDAAELRPLGRIATEEDAPRGTLAAADLNGDGKLEVIMLTRKGRIVVIGSDDGRIKWYTEGAMDAASAALADLNGDGVVDVLAAGGADFALGFSGRDGSLIWRAEEPGASRTGQGKESLRALVTTPLAGGAVAFLVGSDPGGSSVRAVGLPSGSVKKVAAR